MKIEIHHIPSQGLVLTDQKEAEAFAALKEMLAVGECRFKAPLAIEIEVTPAKDCIEVNGRLDTVVALECSRCLAPFDFMLQHDFRLTYSQIIPNALNADNPEGAEVTAEQIGVVFFKGDEIDFSDAIQEQVVMALPYRALCKETCKGLCPHCGTDLNKGECRCDGQPVSGPFDVLKGLKLSS